MALGRWIEGFIYTAGQIEQGEYKMLITQKTRITAVIATLLLLSAHPSMERVMQIWSDGDLWAQADTIVIATAKSTEAPKVLPGQEPGDQVTVRTTFVAEHVLKGSSLSTFQLVHEAYVDPKYQPRFMVNGWPGSVNFDEKEKRQYLLFLKHDQEDIYSPLSGQRDPNFSIRILVPYRLGPDGPL